MPWIQKLHLTTLQHVSAHQKMSKPSELDARCHLGQGAGQGSSYTRLGKVYYCSTAVGCTHRATTAAHGCTHNTTTSGLRGFTRLNIQHCRRWLMGRGRPWPQRWPKHRAFVLGRSQTPSSNSEFVTQRFSWRLYVCLQSYRGEIKSARKNRVPNRNTQRRAACDLPVLLPELCFFGFMSSSCGGSGVYHTPPFKLLRQLRGRRRIQRLLCCCCTIPQRLPADVFFFFSDQEDKRLLHFSPARDLQVSRGSRVPPSMWKHCNTPR